jgi:DNA-binding NtrC family response regulator
MCSLDNDHESIERRQSAVQLRITENVATIRGRSSQFTESRAQCGCAIGLIMRASRSQSIGRSLACSRIDAAQGGLSAPTLLGAADAFVRARDRVQAVAASDATVLIEGETGTGKELAARAVHALSGRAAHPLVIINCAAIPDSLIEDELFGHARGAFTDAGQERIGLLLAATRGTLCLDEIGSLSRRAQATLLRVLQDKSFRPLGATMEQRTEARFIALTNTPLWDLVNADLFRADLYYRLCVLPVRLPPLRERREDILPLAHHFLEKHARRERAVTTLSAPVQRVLLNYGWPGNIRQLEHAILRAAQLAAGTSVELEDLDLPGVDLDGSREASAESDVSFTVLKRRTIEAFERQYLTRLMEQCRGNVTHVARKAQRERRDVGKLLKKYQIHPKTFTG